MTPELARWLDPGADLPPGGLVFRPSPIAAIVPLLNTAVGLGSGLLFAGLAAVLSGVPILSAALGSLALTGPFAFFALLGVVAPILQILTTRYVLHEDGVTVRAQFFARSEQRVEWPKVTALVQKRTIMDRLLGLERLDVVAYGVRGTTLHFVGLRPADPVRDHIARRMRSNASVANLFAND